MRQFAVRCILWYVRFFARLALSIHRPVVFGIAGSVGKTSTKYALFAILKNEGKTVLTKGNSETGVPLGILGVDIEGYRAVDWLYALLKAPLGMFNLVGVKYLIVEMGIDDPFPPKNMEYLLSIVAPDIGIIVMESAAHTEQFEKILSPEEKKLPALQRRNVLVSRITSEDVKMARHPRCTKLIYNADNAFIRDEIKKVGKTILIPFGTGRGNTLSYDDYEIGLEQSVFYYTLHGKRLVVRVAGYALPREYREVFGAAVLAAHEVGVTSERISQALSEQVELPKGRSTVLQGIRSSIIIDSSYNASTVSVMAFLDLVFHLKQKTGRPVVLCLGDMRELGAESAAEHREVAKRIPHVADYVYCVGRLMKQYVMPEIENTGLQEQKWFQTSPELGVYLKEHMPEGALVLVKGSQNTIFLEEAIKYILADKADEKKLCRQESYWRKKWN